MHSPLIPAPLTLLLQPLASIDTDWLVVPWLEGEADPVIASVDEAVGGQLLAARESGEWKGKRFDLLTFQVVSGAFHARTIVVVAGGPIAEYTPAVARAAASTAALQARDRKASRMVFLHRQRPGQPGGAEPAPAAEWLQAIAEGLTLAEFDSGRYKSNGSARGSVTASIAMEETAGTGDGAEALRSAVSRGRVIAHCANLARELVNEPGNQLPPRVLADRAREMTEGTRLRVEIFDEQAISDIGMGLLAAVGKGSKEPPRLIVLTHEPEGHRDRSRQVLGLVGKGVTFDSGGISIKSAEGMERMKDDMSGGAAVIAAMRAISLLDVPLKVVGVIPSAENMPGGGALRPGDVVRGAGGRTVEVVNTDAEGRLLLGDAIWFARERGATHLVDIATLTGACMVALGRLTAGVFGRPADWRDSVLDATRRAGEPSWPLPLVDEEREQLDSEIADTTNSGSRYGGAITAALFVGEFAGDTPWAHIDIAGPAWLAEGRRHACKGATGFGVRTFVELAQSMADKGAE